MPFFISQSIGHSIMKYITVLQLEFERDRVPAKGRAFFFNDKKGT
jgi:hypothetical protein